MAIRKGTAEKLALMKGGSFGASSDVQDYYVYDTVIFPAVAGEISFFQTPIGGQFGNGLKTIAETNLKTAQTLPAQQGMLVEAIKYDLIIPDLTGTGNFDLARAFMIILCFTRWIVKLPSREFEWEAPGRLMLPTIHEIGSGSAANQNRIGDFIDRNWKQISTPITIADPNGNPVNFYHEGICKSGDTSIMATLNSCFAALNAAKACFGITYRATLLKSK
jgi:hypothetical protein